MNTHAPSQPTDKIQRASTIGMMLRSVPAFLKDTSQSLWSKGFGILTILYVILPMDFWPELLLGPIGLLDDVGLMTAATLWLFRELSKYTESHPQKS